MKILLACVAGMSTSLLVEKMKKAAKNRDIKDIIIEAVSIDEINEEINNYDIVLLAPQARYKEKMIADICRKANKKYKIIPYQLYGLVDGEKVLDLALSSTEGE